MSVGPESTPVNHLQIDLNTGLRRDTNVGGADGSPYVSESSQTLGHPPQTHEDETVSAEYMADPAFRAASRPLATSHPTETLSRPSVEIVETVARFEELRKEWEELLETSASNGLFLTWEWLHTWWKHLAGDRRLFILAVRSGGRLLALAPLAVRPRHLARLAPFRAVEFLGTGNVGSNYLDLIVRTGSESEALEALAGRLARDRVALDLVQLKGGSCLATGLAARLAERGWATSTARGEVCPYATLVGHSWESYLAAVASEHPSERFGRRLKDLGKRFTVRFEQVASEAERREILPVLVRLHEMRWRGRGGSEAFHTPQLLSFHEELSRLALQRGWLRLFVLRLDGNPAACLYGFRYGRSFYFYQSGFDPAYAKYSVGVVTIGLTIKHAIEEGA
jgi:CelD/BcsL family acetyltransferase involved in cellulose biosynthesis